MDAGNSTGAECARRYGIGPFDRSVQFEEWKDGSKIETNGNRLLRSVLQAGSHAAEGILKAFRGST
jgi:hypothetical protein